MLFPFIFIPRLLIHYLRIFLYIPNNLGMTESQRFLPGGQRLLIVVLCSQSVALPKIMARTLRLGTLVGWMAASVIAIKLFCAPDTPQHTRDH